MNVDKTEVRAELRSLKVICARVERLSPAGRRWLIDWLTAQERRP